MMKFAHTRVLTDRQLCAIFQRARALGAGARREHCNLQQSRTAIRTAGADLWWYIGGCDCGTQAVLIDALRSTEWRKPRAKDPLHPSVLSI